MARPNTRSAHRADRTTAHCPRTGAGQAPKPRAARRREASGLTRTRPWTTRKNHALSGYSGATTHNGVLMVPEEHVRMAYRLIFGREPENDTVVQQLASGSRDLLDLRARMFSSPEFSAQLKALGERPRASQSLVWPPMSVDLATSEQDINTMIDRTAALFVKLGQTEPHWSVVSEDRFRSDRNQRNVRGFRCEWRGSCSGVRCCR